LPDIEALEEAGLLQPAAEASAPVNALDRELSPVGDDQDNVPADLL